MNFGARGVGVAATEFRGVDGFWAGEDRYVSLRVVVVIVGGGSFASFLWSVVSGCPEHNPKPLALDERSSSSCLQKASNN